MKTLYLPLKKQWYEMIESGVKTEEYREIKPYWINRLRNKSPTHLDKVSYHRDCEVCRLLKEYKFEKFEKFERVVFSYGYTKRTMTFEIESITIGYGRTEWGAPANKEVFIIKLGKRL